MEVDLIVEHHWVLTGLWEATDGLGGRKIGGGGGSQKWTSLTL